MKFIARFVFHVFSNTVGLFAASRLIAGFVFTGNFTELLIAAGVLALINMFLRPILKLIFGPLIVLTLGLFIIVVNALTLYILDLFITPLRITGYLPLLYASLLIGLINFLVGWSGKVLFKE